ncbi:DNA-protecting protein DprA [bacterium]|nr:DNA-protecting protein DprA [bacterium]|tara:strand:- start:5511 stop:6371 length:861 start_codon:yes stop_codon:yes gene_type:complete
MNPFGDVPLRTLKGDDIPETLREIPDPPKKLYVQGDLPKDSIYLTVVGARKYSAYGKGACEDIIEGLKNYPFTIVSGLALGIDGIAHKKALEVGLPTIAVPGSGLDPSVIAPRTNYFLAQDIVKSGGALLSEFEPTMPAAPRTFPKRNRIMAGLSQGILIIEATKKSGTLITARLGLDYNKNIFAVPGAITSPTSEGPNWLIKEGATPVTDARDILEVFGFDTQDEPKNKEPLQGKEKELFEHIQKFPNKTDLLEKTGWSITDINIVGTSLELKGLVKDNGETFSF